jgi:hypothetical protein
MRPNSNQFVLSGRLLKAARRELPIVGGARC